MLSSAIDCFLCTTLGHQLLSSNVIELEEKVNYLRHNNDVVCLYTIEPQTMIPETSKESSQGWMIGKKSNTN